MLADVFNDTGTDNDIRRISLFLLVVNLCCLAGVSLTPCFNIFSLTLILDFLQQTFFFFSLDINSVGGSETCVEVTFRYSAEEIIPTSHSYTGSQTLMWSFLSRLSWLCVIAAALWCPSSPVLSRVSAYKTETQRKAS